MITGSSTHRLKDTNCTWNFQSISRVDPMTAVNGAPKAHVRPCVASGVYQRSCNTPLGLALATYAPMRAEWRGSSGCTATATSASMVSKRVVLTWIPLSPPSASGYTNVSMTPNCTGLLRPGKFSNVGLSICQTNTQTVATEVFENREMRAIQAHKEGVE